MDEQEEKHKDDEEEGKEKEEEKTNEKDGEEEEWEWEAEAETEVEEIQRWSNACFQKRPCHEVSCLDGGSRGIRGSFGVGFDLEVDGDGSHEEGLTPVLVEALL